MTTMRDPSSRHGRRLNNVSPATKIYIGAALIVTSLTITIQAAHASAESSRRLVSEGRSLLENGEARPALIRLKNAVKEDPDNAEARFELGSLKLRLGDYPSAEKELDFALERGLPPARILPRLAWALFLQNKFDRLLKLAPCPDDPPCRSDVLAVHARAYLAQKSLPAAAAASLAALDAQPKGLSALNARGAVLFAQGDLVGTTAMVDQILALDPKSAEALSLRGEVFRASGDAGAAIASFRDALVVDPANQGARTRLAVALMSQNRTQEAQGEIDTLLRQAPQSLPAIYLKAVLLLRGGKMAEALAIVRPVEHDIARDPQGATLLALIHAGNNTLEEALSYAEIVHSRSPESLFAVKLLATIDARLGRYDKVVDLLAPRREALAGDGEALDLLGSAHLARGQIKEANDVLAEAVRARPESDLARGHLALTYLRNGDTRAQGIQDFEDLLGRNPDKAQYGAILVGAYLSEGKYDEAIGVATKAVARAPNQPQPLSLRAAVRLIKGDEAEAEKDLNAALARDPGFVPAALMLSDLSVRRGAIDAGRAPIDRALTLAPNDRQALLARARIEIIAEKPGSALPFLARAIDAWPEAIEPRTMQIQLLGATGQTEPMIAAAMELARLNPGNPVALELATRTLLLAGRREQGDEMLKRLKSATPPTAEAQMRLGQVLVQFARLPEASATFFRVARSAPRNLGAWSAAAATDLRLNGLDSARKIVAEAQANNPTSLQASLMTGDILRAAGHLDEAEAFYRAALARTPVADVVLRLFETRVEQGHRHDAIPLIETWLSAHPNDANVRLALADSLLAARDFAAAARHYTLVLATQPRDSVVLNNLAYAYGRLNDPRAIETARRAYLLRPNTPVIADTYGELQYRLGDRRLGAEILRQSYLAAPNDPQIAYHMAVVLADRGESGAAKAVLKPLLDAKPPRDESQEAADLYRRLEGQ